MKQVKFELVPYNRNGWFAVCIDATNWYICMHEMQVGNTGSSVFVYRKSVGFTNTNSGSAISHYSATIDCRDGHVLEWPGMGYVSNHDLAVEKLLVEIIKFYFKSKSQQVFLGFLEEFFPESFVE